MPTLSSVRTVSSNQVWAAPDGSRKIFDLVLDVAGKQFKAKTYSEAIAAIGFSGSVDTYIKPGNNGDQTFVKQTPKESSFGGGRGNGGGKSDRDPYAMYLSYAKDLAVACVQTGTGGKLSFNDDIFQAALAATEAGGAQLFAGRNPGQEQGETVSNSTPEPEYNPDEISMDDLSAALGDVQPHEGDTPWTTNN